ncbi:hypothetical protein PIB30_098707 [Stylosanthes scabra]|uniref:Uncharacterized protein n=1 Tax=Stylosanthes scabra TaxID=79078 RepID=A0ABU6YVI1_9FABA|nr:hypothetical protein [Stylosanthes scabra]
MLMHQPTNEYIDWWVVACRRRFLSTDRMLQDPRGVQLPNDVPPAATQVRDSIVLPRDAPARGRRARMQCPDVRRKGEGRLQADSRMIRRVERMLTRRLSAVDRRTYPMGLMCMIRAGLTPWHRKRILISFRGEGFGSRSAPHESADSPSGCRTHATHV